jgi:hypothetical protein
MTSRPSEFAQPMPVRIIGPSRVSVPNATTITVQGRLVGVARLGQASITQEEARQTYAAMQRLGYLSAPPAPGPV